MPHSIKLSDSIVETVRSEASLRSRSLASQAEYWIRLGRAIERTPGFDPQRVEDALCGRLEVDALSAEEQEAFFASFSLMMEDVSPGYGALFEQRRRAGLGVGEDENGVRLRQLPDGAYESY